LKGPDPTVSAILLERIGIRHPLGHDERHQTRHFRESFQQERKNGSFGGS